MWTQLWRREVYTEGAGRTSVPVVVYVKAPVVNGSNTSGEVGFMDAEPVGEEVRPIGSFCEKGCAESRRMVCAMVG